MSQEERRAIGLILMNMLKMNLNIGFLARARYQEQEDELIVLIGDQSDALFEKIDTFIQEGKLQPPAVRAEGDEG